MLTEASQKNICIDVSDPLLGKREEQQDESDSSENEVK